MKRKPYLLRDVAVPRWELWVFWFIIWVNAVTALLRVW